MYWVVIWAPDILSIWKAVVISCGVTMTHAAAFRRSRKRRIWIIARNKRGKIAPQHSNVPALSHPATSSYLQWNYPNRLRSGIAGLVIARCLIRISTGLSSTPYVSVVLLRSSNQWKGDHPDSADTFKLNSRIQLKFSFHFTVNTLRLYYEEEPVNAVPVKVTICNNI